MRRLILSFDGQERAVDSRARRRDARGRFVSTK
jgi:hypothetical protein